MRTMQPSFLQRYLKAYEHIEGWFQYDAALLFLVYNQLAFPNGSAGNVLEIGVHHGLSTIAMASLRGPGAQLTAVDLFEEQQSWNVSDSGHGDRAKFELNMREFYPDLSFLRVIGRPSNQLAPADLGTGYTFLHIDGGHLPQEVYHDLELCHDVAADGALIALDDYFNPEYPGVCEGAVEYMLRNPGRLRPLVAGYNKVIFEKSSQRRDLNAAFRRAFPQVPRGSADMWKSQIVLLSSPLRQYVDLYASTPEHVVTKSTSGGRARLTTVTGHLRMKTGQTAAVEVKIENLSPEAFPAGEKTFGVSYHLLDPSGAVLQHDNPRTWLTASLAPKTQYVASMKVTAPPQPGEYQLEIDLVWEGVMWFKDVRNPTLRLPLSVS